MNTNQRQIVLIGCDLGNHDQTVRALMRALNSQVSVLDVIRDAPPPAPALSLDFAIKADALADPVFIYGEKRRTKHKGRKNLGAFGKSRRS